MKQHPASVHRIEKLKISESDIKLSSNNFFNFSGETFITNFFKKIEKLRLILRYSFTRCNRCSLQSTLKNSFSPKPLFNLKFSLKENRQKHSNKNAAFSMHSKTGKQITD